MAPHSEVADDALLTSTSLPSSRRHLVDRSFTQLPFDVVSSSGHYLTLSTGETVFDATGGAAVACIGHGNAEVKEAMIKQFEVNTYCNSMLFSSPVCGELAKLVIDGTGNLMEKIYICCSGSEATEAAIKMARQYFVEAGQPERTHFIAREHSYHGNTLGALSLSGHVARRAIYKPLLSTGFSWVPPCNAYRQRLDGESDAEFVKRKADELEAEFQRVGPSNVIAFVAEPLSGASLGCVPYVPGYLAAMKAVCKRHGALFILDEVMSGMGRSGTMHAWQGEHGVVLPGTSEPLDALPDLQMVGKGLGGGYAAIAGVIIGKSVLEALNHGEKGKGTFLHGQTYQALPLSCAAALAVQKIIVRDNLMDNASKQGLVLERLLKEKLASHPHVGDIRGKGMFWGVELVADKKTKEPFDPAWDVSGKIREVALAEELVTFYHGQGTVDGERGDHMIIAPAYTITESEVEDVVGRLVRAVDKLFALLAKEGKDVRTA